ncbi:MAG: hypothetical protein CMJ78_17130 [Planctomycetaceae bacterium]|nr:hypothetical protein [Planctomycetaceae bacterium]
MPADTVQFYNDGPKRPLTGAQQVAESHYRQRFLAGAHEVIAWRTPDSNAINDAWGQRRRVRHAAEVHVPSSVLFGHPHLTGEQVVYRRGHEVEASRSRGRCQALEMARRQWEDLHSAGMENSEVLR